MKRQQIRAYKQFCPVAKGAEIFAERWTPLILRELLCGSHRFNELRRGVPAMSQSLLSQRLKELEWVGVVEKRKDRTGKVWEYHLTDAGEDFRVLVDQLGRWGKRWVFHELREEDLDASLLMWDMHRAVDEKQLPRDRTVIHFHYPDAPQAHRRYWLVLDRGEVDICLHDPGFNVDLAFRSSLRTMTDIWMGMTTFDQAIRQGKLKTDGPNRLVRAFRNWFTLSAFAPEKPRNL